jgi:DNA-directed RNA polymerase specialized sigma24 family protein
MASPSPSDLLWVIGLPFQGRWIVPVVRAAVRSEWPLAQQIARLQLRDEAMARQLMEVAIERTWEQLADLPPVTVDEARRHLRRHYKNAVRREKRSTSRLSFLGLSSDLEVLATPADSQENDIGARLDLDSILRDTPPDLRHALLTRYGARAQWNEVSENSSRSKDSIRVACQRELDRLRGRLGIKDRIKETSPRAREMRWKERSE